MSEITWTPKLVQLDELIENPNNPKITTEVGKKRLEKSLEKFGLAGTIPVNLDMKIINGHSKKAKLKEQGVTEVWVSVPSRMLTDKEYEEFNAIFDVAKAGDPDYSVMSEEILNEWIQDETPVEKSGKKNKGKDEALYPLTPKFNEKYDAIIIISDNETDTAFLINRLKLEIEQSYKSSHVGQSFVTTAKKVQECLK